MDVAAFERALGDLSMEDIRDIAHDLAAACTSPAEEIAGTRSVLIIEQTLRRTHRLNSAASAALGAATSVQDVAEKANLELPDDDVTRVARAAAQFARGLVASDVPGVEAALRTLGRGWHRFPCLADFQAA